MRKEDGHIVETAVEARFQEFFVEAMAIPHKTARFEKLRAVVALPAPKPAAEGSRRERRARRA